MKFATSPVALLLLVVGQALAQDAEAIRQYGEAIRDRSLFVLGEEGLLRRLENEKLSPDQRISLSLQLSRTLFEHGILEVGASRHDLWERSEQTLRSQLDQTVERPQAAELRTELAVSASNQAAIVAWEATLSPENEALRVDAVTRLNNAIRLLQVEIQELAPGTTWPTQGRETPATLERMRAQLRQRSQLERIECDLWMAQLTDDLQKRTTLMVDVNHQLDQLGRPAGESAFNAAVLLLKARRARILNDQKLIDQLLAASSSGRLTATDQDTILAERLRIELATRNFVAAMDHLKTRLSEAAPPSSELRSVAVQSLLLASAQADQEGKSHEAAAFLEEARRQHERISGRWRLESGTRIQRFQQDQEYGPEVAALVRKATLEWQSNQPIVAADGFAQASRAAMTAGKQDQAYTLGLQSVSLLIEAAKWTESEALLTELLTQAPNHSRAADADLLRCYALGRIDSTGSVFQQAAQDHLRRFPQSATRWDIIRMVAASLESKHPAEAILWYHQIPDDQPLRDTADLRTLSLYLTGLNEPWFKDSIQRQGEAQEAIRRVEQRLKRTPTPWTIQQCQIGLLAIRLMSSPTRPAATEGQAMLTLLQSQVDAQQALATRHQEQLSPEWRGIKESVIQLRIVSLAAEGDISSARTLLQSMLTGDSALLMNVLAGLNAVASQLPADQLYELGHLRLQIVRALGPKRQTFSPDEQLSFDRIAAEAHLAAEDWSGAIQLYEKLHTAHPTRQEFISPLIQASLKQGLPDDLSRALTLSRQLERQHRAGSLEWITSRVQQAEILRLQGEFHAAQKLIGVTRTLYPRMGTPELKARSERAAQP